MPRRVLLIEDEPTIAETAAYALRTGGFDVGLAATGGEGVAALDAGGADAVILDVGLPDMDGFEVCRRIRMRSNVPVVFLTARKEEIDRVVGLEIGGDDYVVKPFSPRELVARVKAILRRAAPAEVHPAGLPPGLAPAGTPFRQDADRCVIEYFGRRLDLTRIEYRLLSVFIQHPGRVYSRDQLMEQAWDDPGSSLDRTIDAHVKTLRAKLRAVRPKIDPIVTHRGMGYSLREDW